VEEKERSVAVAAVAAAAPTTTAQCIYQKMQKVESCVVEEQRQEGCVQFLCLCVTFFVTLDVYGFCEISLSSLLSVAWH
jgi:hypothetical protein